MNNWQTWITILLILTLPVTSIANMINTHCQDTSDSTATIIKLSSADHCDNNEKSDITNDSSFPEDCSCDCKESLDCLTHVNTFTISAYIRLPITFSDSQPIFDRIDQFVSFQPPPLIRPPITIF